MALRPALQENGGVWLGWSGKIAPGDELETRIVRHKNIEYVVINLSKDDFEEYYSGFANRVLWPILHYRLDLAEFARRDLSGYSRVNEHFATKLEKIIDYDDLIWVHDYHLIPIAGWVAPPWVPQPDRIFPARSVSPTGGADLAAERMSTSSRCSWNTTLWASRRRAMPRISFAT